MSDEVLREWMRTAAGELGLAELPDVDIALILDVARDAAHGVARPAAPLTTFLLGVAVGASADGRDAFDVQAAARRIAAAAESAR